MGCGSSQAVSVANATAENRPNKKKSQVDNKLLVSSVTEAEPEITKVESLPPPSQPREITLFEDRPALETRKSAFMPLIPLNEKPNYQGTPFDSGKSSKADFQSGFDLDKVSQASSPFSDGDSGYLDKEYKNVITEKSDIENVQKVEKEFKEKIALKLGIDGKSCPPLLSEKEKEKKIQEEQNTQELLKQNGLVQRPLTAKRNYATFEIVEEKLLSHQQTAQSQKVRLPRILREKQKPNLTSDDIEKKLLKANQRKQEQTQLKLKNLQSSVSIVRRSSNGVGADQNQSQAVNDRAQKLRNLRDHLKAKNETDQLPDSAQTPRTDELISELDNFRPKTPAAFRPEY